jgi:hypothetical protein
VLFGGKKSPPQTPGEWYEAGKKEYEDKQKHLEKIKEPRDKAREEFRRGLGLPELKPGWVQLAGF